jgi:antitoxin ParD1/3/4
MVPGKELVMTTVSITIPDGLIHFAEQQAIREGYGTISDYLGAVLEEKQKRQARQELDAKLLEGLQSPLIELTEADWQALEEGRSLEVKSP